MFYVRRYFVNLDGFPACTSGFLITGAVFLHTLQTPAGGGLPAGRELTPACGSFSDGEGLGVGQA